jgi:hypothetical protein
MFLCGGGHSHINVSLSSPSHTLFFPSRTSRTRHRVSLLLISIYISGCICGHGHRRSTRNSIGSHCTPTRSFCLFNARFRLSLLSPVFPFITLSLVCLFAFPFIGHPASSPRAYTHIEEDKYSRLAHIHTHTHTHTGAEGVSCVVCVFAFCSRTPLISLCPASLFLVFIYFPPPPPLSSSPSSLSSITGALFVLAVNGRRLQGRYPSSASFLLAGWLVGWFCLDCYTTFSLTVAGVYPLSSQISIFLPFSSPHLHLSLLASIAVLPRRCTSQRRQ